jgi:hypothetical protein
MRTIKKVVRVDFDNMENREEMATKRIVLFEAMDNASGSASLKVAKFVEKINVNLYKGWNDQLYPQFRIEKKEIE